MAVEYLVTQYDFVKWCSWERLYWPLVCEGDCISFSFYRYGFVKWCSGEGLYGPLVYEDDCINHDECGVLWGGVDRHRCGQGVPGSAGSEYLVQMNGMVYLAEWVYTVVKWCSWERLYWSLVYEDDCISFSLYRYGFVKWCYGEGLYWPLVYEDDTEHRKQNTEHRTRG